jgi:hypothetical protein
LLCPVGVEIQIPSVDHNYHIGWKELFRAAGIRSERRVECGGMLEASLPPAVSTAPVRAFLNLLMTREVCSGEQDLGVHVSLQGDCGDDVRYLAFPQLFLNETVMKAPRPRDSMRLVMSKGLVHRNTDVEQCPWASPCTMRTELRVFKGAVRFDGNPSISNQLADDIQQTHLLGSAFAAGADDQLPRLQVGQRRELRQILEDYRRSISECAAAASQQTQQLLQADFFECTGDFRDAELLSHLNILRHLAAARDQAIDSARFRSDLSRIRRDTASRVATTLNIPIVQSVD